jgi:hypothetical protein
VGHVPRNCGFGRWSLAIQTEQTTRRTRATRSWVALLPTVFLSFLFFFKSPASHAGVPIAVIVHEQVPVNDLSLPELREIFRGERRFWARELTITLLTPPRGTREREVLLKKIYQQRSESQVQHYWVNKLFDNNDNAQAFPKITGSHEMSASLVRTLPGAIALVPANRIPKGVKVLLIDGKKPGEAGYPLYSSG